MHFRTTAAKAAATELMRHSASAEADGTALMLRRTTAHQPRPSHELHTTLFGAETLYIDTNSGAFHVESTPFNANSRGVDANSSSFYTDS